MTYRAVKNRIAVRMGRLPVSKEEAIKLLGELGIKPVDVDICALARSRVGVSTFKRGAHPKDAPETLDCSGLIKWVFGERGIWLPRRSIQQWEFGRDCKHDITFAKPGDVIFRKGRINYRSMLGDEVGHVGILVENKIVVETRNAKFDTVEGPLSDFIADDKLTGVCRFIPDDEDVVTFEFPEDVCVETEDDIVWIIRVAAHKKSATH